MGERRIRRNFSVEFKRQAVVETYMSGASVSVVARRLDINANMLFRWRDDPRYADGEARFLPIEIDGEPVEEVAANPIVSELGIWIADDVRLAIKGEYDPSILGALIRSLRVSA